MLKAQCENCKPIGKTSEKQDEKAKYDTERQRGFLRCLNINALNAPLYENGCIDRKHNFSFLDDKDSLIKRLSLEFCCEACCVSQHQSRCHINTVSIKVGLNFQH